MGAGAHNHRLHSSVSASDALPTATVLAAAKRAASRACADRAMDCAWSDPARARFWIEAIPYVALAALAEVCLDVKRERLARCLRLDPLDGVDELDRLRKAELDLADPIETVVLAIGGGR
jgi:hypothetical protein